MQVRMTKNRYADDQWCLKVKYWWSGWMTKENYEGYGTYERVLAVGDALLGAAHTEVKLNTTKKEMNDE